jgi:hypothetical protein
MASKKVNNILIPEGCLSTAKNFFPGFCQDEIYKMNLISVKTGGYGGSAMYHFATNYVSFRYELCSIPQRTMYYFATTMV